MFGIAGTAELSTFCPGTGTWNRLQDGRIADCEWESQTASGESQTANNGNRTLHSFPSTDAHYARRS